MYLADMCSRSFIARSLQTWWLYVSDEGRERVDVLHLGFLRELLAAEDLLLERPGCTERAVDP
eukprot:466773-Pyramimonas_sp.AAC.1